MVVRRPCPICGQRPCQPQSDPETSNYLDGPSLIRWMEMHELPTKDSLMPNGGRINVPFTKWRGGGTAKLGTIDELLSTTNLSVHDIPDCVWRKYANGRTSAVKHFSKEVQLKAVAAFKSGSSLEAVSKQIGCSKKSVQNWVKKHD